METTTSRYELFDGLTNEQQDHLFYALDWARAAGREYRLIHLGEPAPPSFELALVEGYAEVLRSPDEFDAPT